MNFEVQNGLLLINIFEHNNFLQVINTSMNNDELILEYEPFFP